MQSSSSRTVVSSSRVASSGGASASASMSASASGGGMSMSSSSTRRTYTMSAGASVAPGVSCQIAHSGVKNIVAGRTREKSDMQELNSRFASYIEQVRRLEAQNTQLAANLVSIRQTSGGETLAIKETYETELKQLRVVLDESERQKAEIEVRITSLEDRVADIHVLIDDHRDQDGIDRDTIERLTRMITEYEREISMLRIRVTKFDEERARDKAEVDRLRAEINRLRTDLDAETLIHIQTENECQTTREELEFTKQVLEAEVKELTTIAYRDTTVEVRDFWRGELAQAIQDLRMEYEKRIETSKVELETMYTTKVEEYTTTTTTTTSEVTHVREESERLKVELTTMRERLPALEERHVSLEAQIATITREIEEVRRTHEMEKLTITNEVSETRYELSVVIEELKTLLDAKLSLELEIAAYRKLLEYEESRIVAAKSYSSTTVVSGGSVSMSGGSMSMSGGSASMSGGSVAVGGSSSMSMSASSSSSRMQSSGSSSSTTVTTKTTVSRG